MNYQTQTDTAVVILSYNGKKWHELFLPLICEEAKDNYDVVLIDNACTDETVNFVKNHFPEIYIISLPINSGFTGGYNYGLKQINSKYLVLLSADFEVSKGWFQPLHEAMESNFHLAACMPKIKYYYNKKLFEYAGAAGGFIDKWGYAFCRGRIFEHIEKDEGQYNDRTEIFWAGGGCLFIRNELYQNLGGLEEHFFAHFEEIDLCWRLKSLGYKIECIPQSEVYHVGGSVISYGSPQKLFLNHRNSLAMIFKNTKTTQLIWLLPWRLTLDAVSAYRFLLKGNFQAFKAVAKAHWSFLLNLGLWIKRRKTVVVKSNLSQLSGVYQNSIVIDYFLKGKKYFHQLKFLNEIKRA